MNKKSVHLFVFISLIFMFLIQLNNSQTVLSATNTDFQTALDTAPKGLHWDDSAFSIADFQKAAINRNGKLPVKVTDSNQKSALLNNAKIINVDENDPESTSVIEMTDGNYQTGAVWSNMANENYFDISKDQTASMWLY